MHIQVVENQAIYFICFFFYVNFFFIIILISKYNLECTTTTECTDYNLAIFEKEKYSDEEQMLIFSVQQCILQL